MVRKTTVWIFQATNWWTLARKDLDSKFKLCGDRDETINHIGSECSKLAIKDSTSLDGEGDPLGIVQEI